MPHIAELLSYLLKAQISILFALHAYEIKKAMASQYTHFRLPHHSAELSPLYTVFLLLCPTVLTQTTIELTMSVQYNVNLLN